MRAWSHTLSDICKTLCTHHVFVCKTLLVFMILAFGLSSVHTEKDGT